MLNDGKTTLKVSRNNKATLRDLVPMLLTSIREEEEEEERLEGKSITGLSAPPDVTLSDRGETETNIL